jgi:hypothetical protein
MVNATERLERVLREGRAFRSWWKNKYGDIEPDCEHLARLFKAIEDWDD